MDKITIIIPTFNGAGHLAALIESIKQQEQQPARVIFIDDGSTDRTLSIIVELGQGTWEVMLNPANLGLYQTLSNTLRLVTTPLVCILFQDDVIKPDHLKALGEISMQYPNTSLFWSAHDIIVDDGGVKTEGLDTGRAVVIYPGTQAWKSTLLRGCYWTISGSLSRSEALKRLLFRPDLPHCGDYELLLRVVRNEQILYLERPLVKIRQHQGQASATNLFRATDIRERLLVFREQIYLYELDVNISLRGALLIQSLRLIIGRSGGHFRRGRFKEGLATLALAVPAFRYTLLS